MHPQQVVSQINQELVEALVAGFGPQNTRDTRESPHVAHVWVPQLTDEPFVIRRTSIEYPKDVPPVLVAVIDLDHRAVLASHN